MTDRPRTLVEQYQEHAEDVGHIQALSDLLTLAGLLWFASGVWLVSKLVRAFASPNGK